MGVQGEIDKSSWSKIVVSRKEQRNYVMNLSFLEIEALDEVPRKLNLVSAPAPKSKRARAPPPRRVRRNGGARGGLPSGERDGPGRFRGTPTSADSRSRRGRASAEDPRGGRGAAAARLHGLSAARLVSAEYRRPRPRLVSAEYPRGSRRCGLSPRNIHLIAAAPTRLHGLSAAAATTRLHGLSAAAAPDSPLRTIHVPAAAPTRLHGLSTWQPRRRCGSSADSAETELSPRPQVHPLKAKEGEEPVKLAKDAPPPRRRLKSGSVR